MRMSLILGVVGAIIALLLGIVYFAIGNVNGQMYPLLSNLTIVGAIAFVAAIIGFAGAIMGKKAGGALMIIAGLLSIVAGAGAFLSLLLLVIGGILALREKKETETPRVDTLT